MGEGTARVEEVKTVALGGMFWKKLFLDKRINSLNFEEKRFKD